MEYRKLIDVEFKEFDREALEKSREWLNDPEMKELTMTPDFDKESQEKWFESLKNRTDYFLQTTLHNGNPIGVVGIKKMTEKDGEIFGYLGEKDYWGKTAGVQMTQHLIDYATSRNLESIYCITLKTNVRLYKLCRRFGFEVEKDVDDKSIMMRLYL
ncbi:GNAT family N-acetyltransferase [Petrimonas sp.]|uniref:GNAT family N-acetyltransferase n=1 Tax=Petrimonas sp. TaxID=2023866 RepID=UPI003F519ED1